MPYREFEKLRESSIPSLNLSVQEYAHPRTGARHFHLASEDRNNAFLVAFRTIPRDSTGVAHILEHTTLCGSRHYPVRDPFFMMIRRSLNTFMNAFTSNDWTAYPFATQNRKDFDNLLRVYLDAVFFPNLDPLDFAQEGHRVEFAEPDNPDSELVFKGVVFNEMKGAMSAPTRRLWQDLQTRIFPSTTYHYNSGGEPRDIPDLQYEELTAFHRTHYHPSNAVFMTYGDFPATEHQARISELVLSEFERQDLAVEIPLEKRFTQAQSVETRYALDPAEDAGGKTHIVLGWLLGESADLREAMHTQLLSDVLLDNSASPLRKVLETTDLGAAPSELCGIDDDLKEMVFACGLEGSDPDRAEAVEQLVLNTLREIAENGVPVSQVEAVLHQLELSQREVGGGRFPYGLQLMVKALPAILHRADPVQVLDIDQVLEDLRDRVRDPHFIPSLIRRLLIDNPHRIRLTMVPDKELNNREEDAERVRLSQLRARMDADRAQAVIEQTVALKQRQEQVDDPDILPRVGLEDVPPTLEIPESRTESGDRMPMTWFDQPTNGLVYEQVVVALPELPSDLTAILPLFCDFYAEVGCNGHDYLETQSRQAAVSGGISARASVRASVEDVCTVKGVFALAGKALVRNAHEMTELLRDTLRSVRFDELPRLRELVAQTRAYREAQITSHGHVLAMTAASARMSPAGALGQQWSGMDGIRSVKALDEQLDQESELESLARQFALIQTAIGRSGRQMLIVAEHEQHSELRQIVGTLGEDVAGNPLPAPFTGPSPQGRVRQAWSTSTQVNFCAKAYPTVALTHSDAAALMVLGPYLRNGYLHRAVREQGGAYGAGAGYNSDTGAFRFFSYRDPRLSGTLDDFDRSVDWLLGASHGDRELEEAILNVVSDIDRPESPAGKATSAFFGTLHGRTPETRRRFRQMILDVDTADLKRVAETYLTAERASIAVISDPQTLEKEALDLELCTL